jgi:hypothetical protein
MAADPIPAATAEAEAEAVEAKGQAMSKEQAWQQIRQIGAAKLAMRQRFGWQSKLAMDYCREQNREIDRLLAIMCPRPQVNP